MNEASRDARNAHHSGVGAWVDHHFYSLVASLGRFLGKPWSSALTVGVMAVALALPLGLWLVLGNVERFSGQVQQSREIGVFLKKDVDAAHASAVDEETGEAVAAALGDTEPAPAWESPACPVARDRALSAVRDGAIPDA